MFTRDAPSGRQIGGMLLGFIGSALIIGWSGSGGPGLSASVLAVASGVCWAAFILASRPLVRAEKLLPLVTLLWGVGAVCLLATCLAKGENILQITSRQMLRSIMLGAGSVALSFLCLLKCLDVSSAPAAGAFWYMAAVFGILWHMQGGRSPAILTALGVALVAAAVYCAGGGNKRRGYSLSDVIRA
jgi:drug/metabolite transporter (DMT)-like permease